MESLVRPDTALHKSFVEAVEEFHQEGRSTRLSLPELLEPAVFDSYIHDLIEESNEDEARPEWMVPQTTFWWISGSTFIGRISVRHRLTDQLRAVGGHIGYEVRPSQRRRGHATAMLAAVLPEAARLGIDAVLVTCDDTNTASKRVIEKNGGVLEDASGGKMRFWIATRGAHG